MTLAEYSLKCQGFNDHLKYLELQQESLAMWQAEAIAGFSYGGEKFNPQQFWDERQENKKGRPQTDSDEELIKLAQEKGIKTPEKW